MNTGRRRLHRAICRIRGRVVGGALSGVGSRILSGPRGRILGRN